MRSQRTALTAALVVCMALALAGPAPAEDPAVDIDLTYFKGSITDVGIQRGPGQVGGVEFRIEGEFVYDGPIDLSHASLVLVKLFAEQTPAGDVELMKMMEEASSLLLAGMARRRGEKRDG